MIRTQIQSTDEQVRRVKRIAVERQVSMATVIREGVDLLLRSAETAATDDERIERAISVVGQFRSGSDDGAAQHDAHLQKAYRR
ncbi:MAG: CopG family transcriptional regulator [Gemmatimonadetes bacterium]|nr:CopG family transcriptional regulator [Gemmatimonadota bacterium]MYB68485.1 CopG family transcriptional regulator [Gemmatimonadota bacterium]